MGPEGRKRGGRWVVPMQDLGGPEASPASRVSMAAEEQWARWLRGRVSKPRESERPGPVPACGLEGTSSGRLGPALRPPLGQVERDLCPGGRGPATVLTALSWRAPARGWTPAPLRLHPPLLGAEVPGTAVPGNPCLPASGPQPPLLLSLHHGTPATHAAPAGRATGQQP